MPGNIQKPTEEFRDAELDPGLLATPYQIQTNWRVITGAPCSGKSTLIELLAKHGHQVVTESARICIKEEVAKGRSMQDIRSDLIALQRKIENMELQVERELPPQALLFLDEAVPGSLAWHRWYGLDPNEILLNCFHRRYASVFILERLPFKVDEERVPEMDAIAAFLDEWYPRDYRVLGYDIVRVPVLPPEERLAFILERVSDQAQAKDPVA